jgi:toxin ParE1/3/4
MSDDRCERGDVGLEFRAGDDLDGILEHLLEHQIADARSRIEDIILALGVLERNPLIGRRVRADLRELVIGHGSRCYIALYRYVPELDTVFVLATRGQREAGYAES